LLKINYISNIGEWINIKEVKKKEGEFKNIEEEMTIEEDKSIEVKIIEGVKIEKV